LFNINLIKKFKNYNFIIEHFLKFKTFSQCICINVYMRSVAPTIWTPKRFQIKKCSIQKLFKISKLQLYYRVKFQIQSVFIIHAHKYLHSIHYTCGSDTITSLRQKSFKYKKMLKISKPKVLLHNKNLNSKHFILARLIIKNYKR
jgi:hypothetical protein